MRFELNRQADEQLMQSAEMRRFLGQLAGETVAEMERRAPEMVSRNATFRTEVHDGEGRAIVKSPFWHWAEYGTAGRHFRTPQPFIRPAAQSIISRYRGRWKAQ